MSREPRGERRADVRSAVQTAHLRSAWVENDAPPENFLPQFSAARQVTSDPETNLQIDNLFDHLQLNMRGFF